MLDYAGRANAETQLVALIEHPRAIENIDEILSVEGLGGAIAAPFDLAVNMGFTDGPNHPEVQEALAHASKKIAAKGFPLTSFAVTPEQGRAALSRGVTVLFLGFDTMPGSGVRMGSSPFMRPLRRSHWTCSQWGSDAKPSPEPKSHGRPALLMSASSPCSD